MIIDDETEDEEESPVILDEDGEIPVIESPDWIEEIKEEEEEEKAELIPEPVVSSIEAIDGEDEDYEEMEVEEEEEEDIPEEEEIEAPPTI